MKCYSLRADDPPTAKTNNAILKQSRYGRERNEYKCTVYDNRIGDVKFDYEKCTDE